MSEVQNSSIGATETLRRVDRRSCFLRSVCQDAERITACDILNLSSTGARLNFSRSVSLPKSFQLHLQLRARDRVVLEATPVWFEESGEEGCSVGVTFLGTEDDIRRIEDFVLLKVS